MPKRKAKECVNPTVEDKNDDKRDKRIRREEKKDDFVDEEGINYSTTQLTNLGFLSSFGSDFGVFWVTFV